MVGMVSFSSWSFSIGGVSSSGMRFLRSCGRHSIGVRGMNRFGCYRRRLSRGLCCRLSRLCGSQGGLLIRDGRRRQFRRGGIAIAGNGSARGALDRMWRQDGRLLLDLEVRDLLLDLGLKLVGGAAEFVHEFADLAGDLRQFLRPEDDKGQEKEEDRLGKTHRDSSYFFASKAAMLRRRGRDKSIESGERLNRGKHRSPQILGAVLLQRT